MPDAIAIAAASAITPLHADTAYVRFRRYFAAAF